MTDNNDGSNNDHNEKLKVKEESQRSNVANASEEDVVAQAIRNYLDKSVQAKSIKTSDNREYEEK